MGVATKPQYRTYKISKILIFIALFVFLSPNVKAKNTCLNSLVKGLEQNFPLHHSKAPAHILLNQKDLIYSITTFEKHSYTPLADRMWTLEELKNPPDVNLLFYSESPNSFTQKAIAYEKKRKIKAQFLVEAEDYKNQSTKKNRMDKKKDLEQILGYRAYFHTHLKTLKEELGEDITEEYYSAIITESAERAVLFLIAEEVNIEVFLHKKKNLKAKISRFGEHKLNKRAKQLHLSYPSVSVYYDDSDRNAGSFTPFLLNIELSSYEVLKLDPKNVTFGHEVRHMLNHLEGTRHTGSATAKKNAYLPIGEGADYGKHQALEEAETYSYTVRRIAKELWHLIKQNSKTEEDVEQKSLELMHRVILGHQIAIRNKLILEQIITENTFNYGDIHIKTKKITKLGLTKKVVRYSLDYGDDNFDYNFIVYDPRIQTTEDILSHVESKIYEFLTLLAPNYMVQFSVSRSATELFLKAKTDRERAAILEGLISITRPHFWDESNFVELTEADLFSRFNSVVTDRWNRFSHL
jgi:hypothetical protein